MALDQIKQLLAKGSVKQLMAGVDTSLRLIDEIKPVLKKSESNADVSKWMSDLNKLQKQTIPKQTVVGVFGNTGAGKSSLINAVLGEDSLVPTSGMRACTAVVTELSWDENEDPRRKYIAEVQFITADDWAAELRVIIDDVPLAGVQAETFLPSSDPEVAAAMAKISAVYPDLDHNVLKQGAGAIDQLVGYPSVKELLGVTNHLYADSAQALHAQLNPFIDSRQNGKSTSSMSTWPLIKVVRIFTRSPVLENGLVLVDLPGLQDSNAARCAVAENYKEKCSGYWIVAPITRGVDDKSAQALMGESFKRQLQMDGGISNVTIIYTKTDDITVTEIAKDLNGDWKQEVDAIYTRTEKVERLIQEKINDIAQLKTDIDVAELARAQKGKLIQETTRRIHGVRVSPRKRRLSDGAIPEAKRKSPAIDADIKPSPDVGVKSSSPTPVSDPEAIDADGASSQRAIELVIETLQQDSDKLKETCDDKKKRHATSDKERKELKTELNNLRTRLKKTCIQFRNNFSRTTARQQFVRGIKELDDEVAQEQDEDNFDPSQDQRDYGELARQLQVFCLSSRAYLKLSGKLKQDEVVSGFENLDDTEVPLLQQRARELADGIRASACRTFLNDMAQILRSLQLRIATNGDPLKLAANQKRKENRVLTKNLDALTEELAKAESELFASLKQSENYVLGNLKFGCGSCQKEAENIVSGWFRPHKEGGYSFGVFRAACKNGGVNTKSGVDLNSELIKPVRVNTARCWEEVFTKNIFEALEDFGRKSSKTLEDFRKNMEDRDLLNQTAVSVTAFSELVKGYEQTLQDITNIKNMVTEEQRTAYRLIQPAIARIMAPLYPDCSKEQGNGTFKRIKARVLQHVAAHSNMYTTAIKDVETRIKSMLENLKTSQSKRNKRILDDIKGRYSELVKAKKISKSLNTTLGHLRELLDGADALYANILVANGDKAGGADCADKQHDAGNADRSKDVPMSDVKEDDEEDSD
ncbi:hypothetical protein GE09DRAFT_715764 [Coniochaeta sp. 2T2.1]|nr:hypothetical protein GE09DRAFT_715764 [Coniochaeta sp. 2T2.1]